MKRALEVKLKTPFPIPKAPSSRHTKQTSKNVADTTLKDLFPRKIKTTVSNFYLK